MESFSSVDRMSPRAGSMPASAVGLEPNAEVVVQRESSPRTSQASVSAALAAAQAAARGGLTGVRFPGEDGGRSLGEMAQRDLDAALQLLTDRAQYITGSSGAAIALRRSGESNMLCRASTGSNAPELGALLSTEFGLSGESVRTRQILRCDDAERDTRVNQEVCREMGIASVVVMPVVHDDEVLGVFELFSGKAQAFGERDLTALRRLSEMVETAVTLARTAEGIPERIEAGTAAVEQDDADDILEAQDPVVEVEAVAMEPPATLEELETSEVLESGAAPAAVAERRVVPTPELPKAVAPGETHEAIQAHTEADVALSLPSTVPEPRPSESGPTNLASPNFVPAKKPLLWSAALNVSDDGPKAAERDQSHVPPAFRNLRKCEACGFPVSAGRALCVECEEKKWRGQLKMSRAVTMAAASGAAAAAAPARELRAPELHNPVVPAPSSLTKAAPTTEPMAVSKTAETKELATMAPVPAPALPVPEPAQEAAEPTIPTLVLSAGLEPSQSWLARNKYIVGALLVVAGSVAAILLLR